MQKKQEKNQINNLTLYLRQLEKEEMKKAKVSRRKEIIKIRAEINEKKQRRPMWQQPQAFQGTPRQELRRAAGAQRTVHSQGRGRLLPKK